MDGAGDAGSAHVPPGHFANWSREYGPRKVQPFVLESFKQLMVRSGKPELLNLFNHLDPDMADDAYDVYEDVSDFEDDDDDDDDEDDDDDVPNFASASTFCGFQKSFLNNHAPETCSNNPFFNLTMPLQHIVTPEEAEKNAKELVAEEERIKNKAEKKKIKKQRQKDRKRHQKLEEELQNKKKEIKNKNEVQNGSGDISSIKASGNGEDCDSSSVEKGSSACSEKGGIEDLPPPVSTCSEYTEDSDEEEFNDLVDLDAELDMASSFVNQVLHKVENKPKVERMEKYKKNEAKTSERPSNNLPNKSPTKLQEPLQMKKTECVPGINPIQQCMEFAALGNNMANGGHFAAAVVYFTEAIKLNPRDHRLFGNRSYCWERMGRFQEALGDAEVSISLDPTFLKGYFRKGKSLMGLKNYTEAMLTFNHILRKESTHVDAAEQLKECQRLQQRAVLNSKNRKMPDLVPTHQDLRQPVPGKQTESGKLVSAMGGMSLDSTLPPSKPHGDYPVLITTSGLKPNVTATSENSAKSTKQPAVSLLQQKSLFTPSQLYPIWVGNVTTRITGEILLAHFKKFGPVHSVRILYDRTCAFVNFASKEAAETAYAKLQGAEVEDTKFTLQLRHPDHASNTTSGRKTVK